MRARVMPRLALIAIAWFVVVEGAACATSTEQAPATRPATARSAASVTTRSAVAANTPAPPPCPAGSDELRCADVSSMEPAPVLRIVDGDTLHVEFEGRDEAVRLYGIDAPEVGTRCADEATARLRELADSNVRMRRDARDRDRYKRLLRYVYTANGESIDATLVREGLARAWRGDGQFEGEITVLEDDARSAGRGCLWRGM